MAASGIAAHPASPTDWARLARRSRRRRLWARGALLSFLVVVSIPVLLPYLWMVTISVSARTGGVETAVLWKACAVLVPAIFTGALLAAVIEGRRAKAWALAAVAAIALFSLALIIGADVHGDNYRFLWDPNIVEQLRGASGAGGGQFPWVWSAFGNSLVVAGAQTVMVTGVATLAGYAISRFAFAGRATFMQSLLVLHAFPAMTLVIPIFLLMHWTGMLDTLTGVILVIATLELPFAVFIMKGFFDAVPWETEMSALADGASRRQAFLRVVLPQVKAGFFAIAVFAFIKGWEEYVFVRTLLFEKSNWVMSLYLFWVSDDIMGVDYGIVAAVGVFYVLPSLLLYIFCQRYLVQLSLGGIKG